MQQMNREDMQSYLKFKQKMQFEAAKAQVGKLEYTLTDVAVEKGTLRRACQDAARLGLGGLCVLPCLVRPLKSLRAEADFTIVACVSYPFGADVTDIKVKAVKRALRDGAGEVEVTAPIAYIKDGNWGYVRREFKKLKKAVKKLPLRVNVESSLLTDDELTRVCHLAADCGVNSVKASSAAFSSDFLADNVSKMRGAIKDRCAIKADCISSVAELNLAVDLGATVAGSKNAADIAQLILSAANAEMKEVISEV